MACAKTSRQEDGWVYVEQTQYVVKVNSEKPGVIVTGPHGVILTLDDSNGDGDFDVLRYMSYDENGEQAIEVEDYDVNGDTNVRWHWQKPSFMELWHSNGWRRLHKRDKDFFLEFDGNIVPVKYENERFTAHGFNQ